MSTLSHQRKKILLTQKPSNLSNGLPKEEITRLDIIVEETNASHTIDEMNVKKIFVF